MRIFFDTEFTGLHQHTSLISIGFVAENGREFYAEFTDYDKRQIDQWLFDNVLHNLIYKSGRNRAYTDGAHAGREGDRKYIARAIKEWFAEFENIELWSDCLSYDWVLLAELIMDFSTGYPKFPDNIFYHPFDLLTLFQTKGIDPDVSREGFAGLSDGKAHNALWDAKVIKACYEKLASTP